MYSSISNNFEDNLIGTLDELTITNKAQMSHNTATNGKSIINNANNGSVDSLLIHNYQYSPSQSNSLLSIPIGNNSIQNTNYTQQLLQLQMQQQMQHTNVTYRKVRPEPINEKTLVSSVVGFFHDVVGGDNLKTQTGHSTSKPITANASPNPNVPLEIKEQIEWLHFEYFYLLDSSCSSKSKLSNTPFANSNIILVVGYKTGFSVWSIDVNGVAAEALSIKEPNITHVKLLQIENHSKLLIAISKLIVNDVSANNIGYNDNNYDNEFNSQSPYASISPQLNKNLSSSVSSSSSTSSTSINNQQIPSAASAGVDSSTKEKQQNQKKYRISIVNLLNGETLNEIVFNGDILEMKSNADILCINSWNRIDAFDLSTFEHRFTINTCFSQISKSTGQTINPFALGHRWIAFADNKYHSLLNSIGGVCTDIEQSYTATVFNTAKSISKGLVKISETVVNSVVSKSKSSSTNGGSSTGNHSPRLGGKTRHDSKEEFQSGLCTIVDTKKYINTSAKPHCLHDENQNWIVAHFLAHQEPIYAIEFNNNGRLLVTADSLGQYFNVFQINANSFKCTRTVVKHLYSLYRGDTNAKVRNISFSNDSRWLAISTKRGTTHIFPINSYGGAVNARTHSKPYVVNRTAKHQRTAGFILEQEDAVGGHLASSNVIKMPLVNNSNLLNANGSINDLQQQQYQMQQMLQQQYDSSSCYPMIINNNPKLKSLLEPHVIQAYGQLKQPNANSTFQSSVISSNASSISSQQNATSGLIAAVTAATTGQQAGLLAGSALAASALSSAALVTENVTNFASNTTNMIQYDNVYAVAVFGESRGYLSPEEPREFNRLKAANSLFVISDVNGNLVEYVLDIAVDASKSSGNKPTNDSPITLKLTPKAQWPLQRFISSDEVRYPIHPDNPLLMNGPQRNGLRKQSSSSNGSNCSDTATLNYNSHNPYSYSPSSLISNSPSMFQTAQNSLNSFNSLSHQTNPTNVNNDWIKMIEVNTHIGPHRRLFMGPQFVFKTFNSNLTTTMLNPASSSVMSEVETPIIDLSGDIELNSLDLTSNNPSLLGFNPSHNKHLSNINNRHFITSPMQINPNGTSSSIQKNPYHKVLQKFDCTPTYIEVGSGSFQEGMPIMCGSSLGGSQKSLNGAGYDITMGDNLIESLADAMNEINSNNTSNNSIGVGSNHSPILMPQIASGNKTNKATPKSASSASSSKLASSQAIAISNATSSNKPKEPSLLLMNANTVPVVAGPSSAGSSSSNSGVFTTGSYFMINTPCNANAVAGGPTVNTSLTSCTSSSSASSSSSSNSHNDDDSVSSNVDIPLRASNSYHSKHNNHRRREEVMENIPFQDDSNLLH